LIEREERSGYLPRTDLNFISLDGLDTVLVAKIKGLSDRCIL